MPSSPAGRQAGVNSCCSFTTVSTVKVLISLALSSFCEDKGGVSDSTLCSLAQLRPKANIRLSHKYLHTYYVPHSDLRGHGSKHKRQYFLPSSYSRSCGPAA